MSLLKLMLSQHVLWPVGAEFAVQDGDDRTVQFCFESPVKSELGQKYWVTPGMAAHSKISINTLADDWSTSIITREEYQAAGGWMKWEGGERPVTKEAPIMYSTKAVTAEPVRAGACSWEHVGDDSDILAYCLTAIIPGCNLERQQKQNKMSNKPEDSNAWHDRGELPPVGSECSAMCYGEWVTVEVLRHRVNNVGMNIAAVMNCTSFNVFWATDFRPLRTEREKAIDALNALVGDIEKYPTWRDAIAAIYDAGYRKVKP